MPRSFVLPLQSPCVCFDFWALGGGEFGRWSEDVQERERCKGLRIWLVEMGSTRSRSKLESNRLLCSCFIWHAKRLQPQACLVSCNPGS
ncbi:hypothetical protein KC19_2G128700 [Ceratodon purpureus]|uniref:Uncharacterized protein n=1 Tax=Ceratodon purpureus TaxID=3225 RepID=A0A8T0IT88_CERPU|nr:hypothetical protein KC19_2G128700 [Ceratodon purpureus]